MAFCRPGSGRRLLPNRPRSTAVDGQHACGQAGRQPAHPARTFCSPPSWYGRQGGLSGHCSRYICGAGAGQRHVGRAPWERRAGLAQVQGWLLLHPPNPPACRPPGLRCRRKHPAHGRCGRCAGRCRQLRAQGSSWRRHALACRALSARQTVPLNGWAALVNSSSGACSREEAYAYKRVGVGQPGCPQSELMGRINTGCCRGERMFSAAVFSPRAEHTQQVLKTKHALSKTAALQNC